ncbi:MAG: TrkH family potassium uptake protein, partial [Oscillospiraceae bacterium]|nr:TrkH family potassium uptake protein [Oscillospiraceae bacterium]
MLNYKLISKIIGSLLLLEAMLMCIALATSLLHLDSVNDQDDVFSFIITICFTAMMGFWARYYGQPDNEVMNRHEAYLLVTITWIVFSFFGSLPFIISGLIPSFTDAFFETMSGFTTTGSSVVENIDEFPSGLKLWRSMTQWIGGLGIAFFTIAILPGLVSGGVRVFSAEATGPIRSRMHPKLSTNAK